MKLSLFISTVLAAVTVLVGADFSLASEISQEISPQEQSRRVTVNSACAATLTNIYSSLFQLTGEFPILDGISKAELRDNHPRLTGVLDWEQHHLKYSKNVTIVPTVPDKTGRIPQSNERHIVEHGGVELEIYLVQGHEKVHITQEYELPYGTANNQLRLIYSLRENPNDPALEKAVQDVIERHVSVLRKILQAQ